MTDTPISDGTAQSTAGIYRFPASKGPFSPGSKAYIQHNFAGTAAPGVGDDSADGYAVGSLWFDTTNAILYICKSAAAGAAVWQQVVASSTPLTLANDDLMQRKAGGWTNRTLAQVKDDINDAVGKGIRVLGASAVAVIS